MEKRIYFDSGRNYFSSIKVGEFFTESDPTKDETCVFMRIEPVIQNECLLCNAVNLETCNVTTWSNEDRVYPVKSVEIDIEM